MTPLYAPRTFSYLIRYLIGKVRRAFGGDYACCFATNCSESSCHCYADDESYCTFYKGNNS